MKHSAPWVVCELGNDEVLIADSDGQRFGYDEAIAAYNALSAENERLLEVLETIASEHAIRASSFDPNWRGFAARTMMAIDAAREAGKEVEGE